MLRNTYLHSAPEYICLSYIKFLWETTRKENVIAGIFVEGFIFFAGALGVVTKVIYKF